MRVGRSARSAAAPVALAGEAVLLTLDAGGFVRIVGRGARCERWLSGIREGVLPAEALASVDRTLARGLAAAVSERRACSGRRVVRPSSRRLRMLSYDVSWPTGGQAPDIVLTTLPSTWEDVLAQLDREQERWAASMEALGMLDTGAGRDGGASAALPNMVRATGMQTGAVFAGGDKDGARMLSAFGPTRKRGYPYPDLRLDCSPLDPLLSGARHLVLGRDRLDGDEALRAVMPSRARWALVAPVRRGDLVTGAVLFGTSDSPPPSLAAGETLDVFADALSLALSTVALSRESDQSAAVLETAAAVARAISGSLDLDDTFRQIALSAAKIMGGCRCLLLQTHDSPHDLVTVASSDPGDVPLIGLRVRFEDEHDPRAALTERRSIVVENIVFGASTEPAVRSRLQVRSALFVPITSEGRPIGSLLFCSRGGADEYSAHDVARAETVAEQAASAICNARLFGDLERSEERAQGLVRRITGLRERQRMEFASVVHDDIVQSVVAALYELEGLRRKVGGDEAVTLERASDLLRCSIIDARRVIHDLRPPVLDGLGLTGALRLLAEHCEEAGMQVATHIEEIEGLSPAATTAFYMVAREALQNARRHANATSIAIRLEIDPELMAGRMCDGPIVALVVKDDGRGIDTPVDMREDHFGLTLMDEQMALAGGCLHVTSIPGAGTCIEAQVPASESSERRTE